MKARLDDLRGGPFTVADARQFGMMWHTLQSRAWRRISYGQYAWAGLQHDVELELRGIAQRMPTSAAFSGLTAAWILGLDFAPCAPVEMTVERDIPVRGRVGVRLRRAALPDCEVDMRKGFRVTAPLRTVRDLGSRKDLVESVVAIDMLDQGCGLDEASVECIAVRSRSRSARRENCWAKPPDSPDHQSKLLLRRQFVRTN
jgi:hypothetical protein